MVPTFCKKNIQKTENLIIKIQILWKTETT